MVAQHVTAEQVHASLRRKRTAFRWPRLQRPASIHGCGLLREVMIDPGRVYFDTHTKAHHIS